LYFIANLNENNLVTSPPCNFSVQETAHPPSYGVTLVIM